MIVNPLDIEVYDASDVQYHPPARNVAFSKAMQGGEDMWLSFMLDRETNIDYPDIGYGHDVIARRGLNALWAGEMREITQDREELTIGCLGRYVHLDDVGYGGQQRLWCDSRYGKWTENTNDIPIVNIFNWTPEKYILNKNYRLYMAPRKNEVFRAGALGSYAGFCYIADTSEIVRVSFDYDIDLAWTTNWALTLYSITPGGAFWSEWAPAWGAAGTGVKDIQINAAGAGVATHLVWYLSCSVGPTTYTGETGEDVYVIITNLRVWGQVETESPSVIHIAEKAVEQVEASTSISADEDLVMEPMFVRDYFTDANGTALANHAPDINKERDAWTIPTGGFDIQSNQANCTALGAGNEAIAVIDSGVSDGIVSLDLPSGASGTKYSGIIFRYQDVNNYWLWGYTPTGGGVLHLYYVQAAGWNLVWSSVVGIEYGFIYNLMVNLRGDRIDCYLGGIWRYGTNNSFLQTETEHGMRLGGANGVGLRADNFEVFQALPIWPVFYEKGESCYEAVEDAASFGDWNLKALAWGVEPGGDRVFLRSPDRDRVRYVIEPQYAEQIVAKGQAHKDFITEAWAKYIDENGVWRWTEKYYAHITRDGIEANTTATGNDLASTVYGVIRDRTLEFGRVDQDLALAFLQQYLREHAHPSVRSSFRVFGPVKDLFHGGAEIDVSEMEMGYLVQIPWFRAVEAYGDVGSDLRDFDTTFLLVGMEYDEDRHMAKLIPEGASEDLRRMIQVARMIEAQEGKLLLEKRPWFPFM